MTEKIALDKIKRLWAEIHEKICGHELFKPASKFLWQWADTEIKTITNFDNKSAVFTQVYHQMSLSESLHILLSMSATISTQHLAFCGKKVENF